MLLKNCSAVLTQDERRTVLKGADILIRDSRIEKVSKNIDSSESECEKIDCRGKIVMPSFVNAHTHLPMVLLRGYRDDLTLNEWLSEVWKAEAKMKEEDYYAGAKFGLLEMIRSGTSAYLDMYFGSEQILKASEKAGLRGYLGHPLMDFGDSEKKEGTLKEAKKSVKKILESNGLCRPVISPHSVYTCSKELLLEAKKFAESKNLLYTTHLSETRKEVYDCHRKYGKRPAEFLEELGVIDNTFVGFHSAWLTKGEISMLAGKKASVVSCPASNMKLATGGAFPYREFREAGVTVGIGTDGACSNNSLNMLGEMKAMCLMQKWLRWNASEMAAQSALDMATLGGAKILGLNSGSIGAGKNADLLLLDKSHYSLLPGTDLVSNIVYSASREAISGLIVNGQFLMQEKQILTLDEEAIKEGFMKSSERLLQGGALKE
ncbi:MAG: amidohydrolase [Candidatus Aenigmarchaeota archaeon]|nr:amidohydrolase [Candidatus Aenigmarchaeota archaeon]